MHMKMDDRRTRKRNRILKAGLITFNRAAGIDCMVRNVSATGACLEVASPVGIPDAFELVINSDNIRQACRVAWRRANRIGIEFTGPPAFVRSTPL